MMSRPMASDSERVRAMGDANFANAATVLDVADRNDATFVGNAVKGFIAVIRWRERARLIEIVRSLAGVSVPAREAVIRAIRAE